MRSFRKRTDRDFDEFFSRYARFAPQEGVEKVKKDEFRLRCIAEDMFSKNTALRYGECTADYADHSC
jgi:hypothetical protein